MDGTKIVTSLVIISLSAGLGCRAKFTSKNGPSSAGPAANATGPATPTGPVSKYPQPQPGPVVTPAPGPVVTPGPQPGPVVRPGPGTLPPPIVQPPATRPPACLTKDDSSVGKDRVVQQKTIVFKRGRQMVWRKNCEGVVVSKKYENIGGNTMKNISLRPVGAQGPMSIFNRTTCHATTSQTSIAGAANGEYNFAVSTQKTNHAMHVKPGQNYIDYTIGSEKGTLILTVRIDETEDDCIVINAKGCAPKREAQWSDTMFGSN